MGRWFRVYDDIINDPKIIKLPEETRWHWIAILCIASKNDGVLPSTEDVAISLRVKTAAAAAIIAGLKSAGLLDQVDGRFIPHNWDGRQFKSDVSNERVKRYRERKRNVPCNVTVTPPDTDTDTDTDTEQISEANASGADAPPDPSIPEREYFFRGREVLGKGAGGLIGKLLKSKGNNVALARAAIEQASQKENPTEYVAAICRGPPRSAKPLTAHQQEREVGRNILDDIGEFIGSSGGQANPGILRHDTGNEPKGIRGRSGGNLIDLSPVRAGKSG